MKKCMRALLLFLYTTEYTAISLSSAAGEIDRKFSKEHRSNIIRNILLLMLFPPKSNLYRRLFTEKSSARGCITCQSEESISYTIISLARARARPSWYIQIYLSRATPVLTHPSLLPEIYTHTHTTRCLVRVDSSPRFYIYIYIRL